jgi:hypothetical protein
MNLPPFNIEDHAPLVHQIADQLKPLLAGKHPTLASAVLADLTALWIVSQCVTKKGQVEAADLASPATRRLQRQRLREHVGLIKHLIEVNATYMRKHYKELPTYFC